jgi:hypothetical protein
MCIRGHVKQHEDGQFTKIIMIDMTFGKFVKVMFSKYIVSDDVERKVPKCD